MKNPNDVVKAATERKLWKSVSGAKEKLQKKDVWPLKKKKRERLKGEYIRAQMG